MERWKGGQHPHLYGRYRRYRQGTSCRRREWLKDCCEPVTPGWGAPDGHCRKRLPLCRQERAVAVIMKKKSREKSPYSLHSAMNQQRTVQAYLLRMFVTVQKSGCMTIPDATCLFICGSLLIPFGQELLFLFLRRIILLLQRKCTGLSFPPFPTLCMCCRIPACLSANMDGNNTYYCGKYPLQDSNETCPKFTEMS